MAQLFDSNGNPVEVMGEEEIKALEEKAKQFDEVQGKLKEKEEALAKMSDKEFNFSKFREAEEGKREEMLKGFSKERKERILEREELLKKIDDVDNRYFGEQKEAVLSQMLGSDKEGRQKFDDLVKEMYPSGVPKDKEGMNKAYKRVMLILEREQGVNPLNKFVPVTGEYPKEGKQDFTTTPQGKSVFESKFGKQLEKAIKRGYKY